MKLLEDRIRKDGKIRNGDVLKVDSFLNHQMDIALFDEIGKEFYRLFGGENVTKILTIEASGIGIACIAARHFGVPVIFAKKNKTKNIAGDVYTSKVESFTHGKVYDIIVSKEFLHAEDRVLLIDDFLANGSALQGLIKLVQDAGATLVGAGNCVEKAFQPGGADFKAVTVGDGVFLIQDWVNGPGNGFAVVDADAALLVNVKPQEPIAALTDIFYIPECAALFADNGFGELPNLIGDFHGKTVLPTRKTGEIPQPSVKSTS